MASVLDFNVERYADEAVRFSRAYLDRFSLSKLVVGASGGLDSTVASLLATRIVGADNVLLLHLPHHKQEEGEQEFNAVGDLVGVPVLNRTCIDIRPMLDAYPHHGNTIQMTNFLTRIQRAILFDYSHKHGAPVFGTLNRTEHELGEYPIFALEASIQPIRLLFKTQVRMLAQYLGLPPYIQDKIPTIDTWLGKLDQINRTKIVMIGIPIVDQILKYSLDLGLSVDAITHLGFKKEDVEFVVWMRNANEYKHALPVLPELEQVFDEREW